MRGAACAESGIHHRNIPSRRCRLQLLHRRQSQPRERVAEDTLTWRLLRCPTMSQKKVSTICTRMAHSTYHRLSELPDPEVSLRETAKRKYSSTMYQYTLDMRRSMNKQFGYVRPPRRLSVAFLIIPFASLSQVPTFRFHLVSVVPILYRFSRAITSVRLICYSKALYQ
jgi:hypothetical protein